MTNRVYTALILLDAFFAAITAATPESLGLNARALAWLVIAKVVVTAGIKLWGDTPDHQRPRFARGPKRVAGSVPSGVES